MERRTGCALNSLNAWAKYCHFSGICSADVNDLGYLDSSVEFISVPFFCAHLLNRPQRMEEPQLEERQSFSAPQPHTLWGCTPAPALWCSRKAAGLQLAPKDPMPGQEPTLLLWATACSMQTVWVYMLQKRQINMLWYSGDLLSLILHEDAFCLLAKANLCLGFCSLFPLCTKLSH